jgi:biopolymer transport protein ExbD
MKKGEGLRAQRMRSVIVIIAVVIFLAGCRRDRAMPSPGGDPLDEKPAVQAAKIIKVKVSASGEISADGQPITLKQLAAKFADLKQVGGQVYHRENPAGEPHPNAMKVIKLVAENKLTIKLSTKPDFSDAVDDKGVSRPSKS